MVHISKDEVSTSLMGVLVTPYNIYYSLYKQYVPAYTVGVLTAIWCSTLVLGSQEYAQTLIFQKAILVLGWP